MRSNRILKIASGVCSVVTGLSSIALGVVTLNDFGGKGTQIFLFAVMATSFLCFLVILFTGKIRKC